MGEGRGRGEGGGVEGKEDGGGESGWELNGVLGTMDCVLLWELRRVRGDLDIGICEGFGLLEKILRIRFLLFFFLISIPQDTFLRARADYLLLSC